MYGLNSVLSIITDSIVFIIMKINNQDYERVFYTHKALTLIINIDTRILGAKRQTL